MDLYLDAEIPEELCQHLFYSFMKKGQMAGAPGALPNAGTGQGKDFHVKDVAVVASQTICAPITNLTSEMHYEKDSSSQSSSRPHSSLVEKIHGLTEKLQHGLGHVRHDSGGDPGRRSRAGTVQSGSPFVCDTWEWLFLVLLHHGCCPLLRPLPEMFLAWWASSSVFENVAHGLFSFSILVELGCAMVTVWNMKILLFLTSMCVIVSLLSSVDGLPVLPPASPYENNLKPSIFATYSCMVWTVPAFCSCPSVLPCKSPSHSALLGSHFLLFLLIGLSMMATVSVPKSFFLSIDSVLFSSLPIPMWPSYIFISTESFFF